MELVSCCCCREPDSHKSVGDLPFTADLEGAQLDAVVCQKAVDDDDIVSASKQDVQSVFSQPANDPLPSKQGTEKICEPPLEAQDRVLLPTPDSTTKVVEESTVCQTYEVEIKGDARIGLDLARLDKNKLFVRDVVPGGAIAAWNDSHSQKVSIGDVLHSVNGCLGNADELAKLLSLNTNQVLKFVIPIRTKVIVNRRSELGLKLKKINQNNDLIIHEITNNGTLDTWNQNHPEEAIAPGDRIIEVCGSTGSATLLAQLLNQKDDFIDFVVARDR